MDALQSRKRALGSQVAEATAQQRPLRRNARQWQGLPFRSRAAVMAVDALAFPGGSASRIPRVAFRRRRCGRSCHLGTSAAVSAAREYLFFCSHQREFSQKHRPGGLWSTRPPAVGLGRRCGAGCLPDPGGVDRAVASDDIPPSSRGEGGQICQTARARRWVDRRGCHLGSTGGDARQVSHT